jgi:hypothetical protein
VRVVVAHFYPDYLNIYADRGNIAVLASRARWRGLHLDVRQIGIGDRTPVGEVDLYYVGGGQDREQALIAPDFAARGERPSRRRSPTASLSWRCAVVISSSGAFTGIGLAPICREQPSYRSTRWPASGG